MFFTFVMHRNGYINSSIRILPFCFTTHPPHDFGRLYLCFVFLAIRSHLSIMKYGRWRWRRYIFLMVYVLAANILYVWKFNIWIQIRHHRWFNEFCISLAFTHSIRSASLSVIIQHTIISNFVLFGLNVHFALCLCRRFVNDSAFSM